MTESSWTQQPVTTHWILHESKQEPDNKDNHVISIDFRERNPGGTRFKVGLIKVWQAESLEEKDRRFCFGGIWKSNAFDFLSVFDWRGRTRRIYLAQSDRRLHSPLRLSLHSREKRHTTPGSPRLTNVTTP